MSQGRALGYIATIGLGIFVGYKIAKSKKVEDVIVLDKTVSLGDKGQDVMRLQKSLNILTVTPQLEANGLYDKKTRDIVVTIFKDSGFLVSEEKGEIKISDLDKLEQLALNLKERTVEGVFKILKLK